MRKGNLRGGKIVVLADWNNVTEGIEGFKYKFNIWNLHVPQYFGIDPDYVEYWDRKIFSFTNTYIHFPYSLLVREFPFICCNVSPCTQRMMKNPQVMPRQVLVNSTEGKQCRGNCPPRGTLLARNAVMTGKLSHAHSQPHGWIFLHRIHVSPPSLPYIIVSWVRW